MQILAALIPTQMVALTLGAEGACLLTPNTKAYQAAPQNLKVQYAVGAGDGFIAALLAHPNSEQLLMPSALSLGLTQSQTEGELHHAVTAASLCIQLAGCDQATWNETLQP